MTHLDLFSGVGGFAIAAQNAGFTTIGFSEIEPYACKILKRHWPGVPNFGDIKNITRQTVADAASFNAGTRRPERPEARVEITNGCNDAGTSLVTLITGGFPCQPFSQAGRRRGKEDNRALWPEMLRVVAECRPVWVLGENVPGIISMELDSVLSDLENLGYSTRAIVIPACAVDARHRRDRVWIVGYSNEAGRREQRRTESVGAQHTAVECGGENVPNCDSGGREEHAQLNGYSIQNTTDRDSCRGHTDGCGSPSRWEPEPRVGRVANGIPNRSHRLRGLGNAIVPAVAEVILRNIARLIP